MIWVFLGQKKRKNVVNFDPAMDKLLKKSCCCSKYEKVWTFKLHIELEPCLQYAIQFGLQNFRNGLKKHSVPEQTISMVF